MGVIPKSSAATPIYFHMRVAEPDVVIQGTWAKDIDNGRIYNGSLRNLVGVADGDGFEVNFRCPSGIYTIRFDTTVAGNRGVLDFYIDGAEQIAWDLYAAGADQNVRREITGKPLGRGEHTIKFLMDGKHASSTDYKLSVGSIVIQRTG